MRQWRLLLLMIAPLLLLSTPDTLSAQPEGLSEWEKAGDLLRSCNSPDGTHAHGVCKGMIFGSVAAIVVMQEIDHKRYVCHPSTATFDDDRDVVIAYLRRDRKGRDRPSLSAIMDALSEQWPCR
jgi:hypothetical protein